MSLKFTLNRKVKQNTDNNEPDKYWKPKSKIWFFASILSLIVALVINIAVPNVQFVNTLPYQIFIGAIIVILLVLWFVSIYFDSLRNLLYHKSQFIFAGGVMFVAIDLLTTKSGIFTLPFFPGPPQVISVIHSERQMLLISTYYSMRLFFVGLISGTLLGVITGILIGWYRQWYYWLYPIIKITGVIPPVAWIPIAIVILPNSFLTGLFLITMASWFSIAFMVSTGIASTPKVYFEVARTLGANERFLLFHVALPNAVPNIFMGLSMATGLSFLTLIVSEMVGAKAGLGFYINWAKAWSAFDKVYASIIIMAVAFSIILAIISVFKNYFLRWQKGILK
jgi:NitT/TauT family transport system permease protein